MLELLCSAFFITAMSIPPNLTSLGSSMFAPSALTMPALSSVTPVPAQTAPRDSFKNGAIIGAIAGGVVGAAVGAYGTAVACLPSGDPDCTDTNTGVFVVAAIGAGIGAVLGIGIDAMFEQAPHPGSRVRPKLVGMRLRVRF